MGMNISRCESASDPTILPPPPPTVGLPLPSEPPPPTPESAYVSEKLKNNPGPYEELHKRCKDVFPLPFEGAKVIINKSLNQGFHISHSVNMSSITPSGYRFGSTYVSAGMVSPQEPAFVIIADVDPSANLNAQGVVNLGESVRLKYMTQIMNNKFATTQLTADIRGKEWTATGSIVNPNMFNNTGIGVVQYLQAVTSKIAVGAELMYQQTPQIPGGAATVLSLCGRFTGSESVWSGFAGSGGMGFCYYRRLNEEIQVGFEIENSLVQQQTNVAVGYQFDLPKANFSMKAMVDNNWTVTGVLEKRLLPMPFMLSLCGSLNHVKNQFRLGMGFTIGV